MLSSLPRRINSPLAKCGCKKHCMDFHGDHTATCTAHSGATKAHDWMVGVLGQSCVFHTAGHTVRTQHGVTASASQGRVNVELSSYLPDDAAAGAWSSTCPLPTTVLGAVATCSRKVCYSITRTSMRLCVLLRSAKLTAIVRTFLKVYMELGSFFLFLQEQIKDIIIIIIGNNV